MLNAMIHLLMDKLSNNHCNQSNFQTFGRLLTIGFNNKNQNPKMLRYLLPFLILFFYYPYCTPLSWPVALQPDVTYQTGIITVVSTNFSSTSVQAFNLSYANNMLTSSLDAAIGIYGIDFYMNKQVFGWSLSISTLSATNFMLHAYVSSALSRISSLKICYIVSNNPYIDMNYVRYTFNSSEQIANYYLSNPLPMVYNNATCFLGYDQCIRSFLHSRSYRLKQSYSPKNSPVVNVFLAGFKVFSVDELREDKFGIELNAINLQTNRYEMEIKVYGSANLEYVEFFYLSYDSNSLNIFHRKAATSGKGSMGCYYTETGCGNGSLHQTKFTTLPTTVVQYTPNMFFIGLNKMILTYSSWSNNFASFNLQSLSQNSDSTLTSSFAFSAINDNYFTSSYAYFTLQTFSCSGPSDNYFLYESNQCDTNCTNVTEFTFGGECLPCNSTCQSCTGRSDFCSSCFSSQNRVLDGNVCKCDALAGFYDDLTSLICPKCHYSCLTCNGPVSSACLTCNLASQRYRLNNSCPCSNGFYDSGVSLCSPCNYTCKSATCSSISCLTCNIAKFRGPSPVSNMCPCLYGYYDTNAQLCQKCHFSCLTCSTSSNNCITCDPSNHFRNLTMNKCPCLAGYYDNSFSVCERCFETCLTCTGGLINNCVTCDIGKSRTLVGSQCVCLSYFYQFNRTCIACHFSCLTCSNSLANGCLSCPSNSSRTFNAVKGLCSCNFGYLQVGVHNCQKCAPSCLDCFLNATSCTLCHNNPGRYLAGSSCLCLSNYIDLSFNGVCTLCHYSCLTCVGNTQTTCSSCGLPRLITNGSCPCPVGQFDNGYNSVCELCDPTCKTCSLATKTSCTDCQILYFRYLYPAPLGSCICKTGYYELGVLQCAACSSKCAACKTQSYMCTACDNSTHHRYITANLTCDCLQGYYETNATVCQACHKICKTCSITSSKCISCHNDRYLQGNTCYCRSGTYQSPITGNCQPCSYTCLNCNINNTACISCPQNSYRQLKSSSCPCLQGFYDNGNTSCSRCSYTCLTCSNLTSCTTCPLNSFRVLNQSIAQSKCLCQDGYYDNNNNAICIKCQSICLTCLNYYTCLTCDIAQYRVYDNISQTCLCNVGYYDNMNSVCLSCHYTCLTCFGSQDNNCLTCTSMRTFTIPYMCPCKVGYYESNKVCAPCYNNCRTCNIIDTNCTSCHHGSYMSNYKCFCNEGYFTNGPNCTICDIRCRSCMITSTNCITCNPLHKTYLNESACVCSGSYYQDNITFICMPCSYSCQTCTASTSNSCLSCNSHHFRTSLTINNTCPCLPGYYEANQSYCKPCLFPCATCYSGSTFSCLTCISNYTRIGTSCSPFITCQNYYYDSKCISICPNTTYPQINVNLNICLGCINGCLTCTSQTVCMSCKMGYFLEGNSCKQICSDGMAPLLLKRQCVKCPDGCKSCVFRNSKLTCVNCQSDRYWLQQNCTSSCPNKTHVIVDFMCKKCLSPCQTCFDLSSNGCITCKYGWVYLNGMCLKNCPFSYSAINGECTLCANHCQRCNETGCQTCHQGYYLTFTYQCIQIGFFLQSKGKKVKCHPNCLTCTDSSFSSCINCVKYRGDQSGLAITGYCDCWKDSIDIGDGICDQQSFKSVQRANQILVSATNVINYVAILTGIVSINFFAPVFSLSYQQFFSNFYYLNSSAVLQTQQVLNTYGNACLNRLIEKQTNKNIKKYSKPFHRMLQATLQQQQSLFMRGYNWKYLIDWASYSFICICIAWVFLLASVFIKRKFLKDGQQESMKGIIINGLVNVFRQNFMILFHLLTINDVGFYAFASFKLLKYNQIDYFKLIFSIILFIYYIAYIVRLIIAGWKYSGKKQQDKKYMIMYAGFNGQMKKNKLSRIYVPIIMVKSLVISLCLVFFAFTPIGQIITSLIIFIVFMVYSFCYCPYNLSLAIFIHIFEVVFLIQLFVLTASAAQPENSRLPSAYALIVFSYFQLANILALILTMLLNRVFNFKFWTTKQKRVLPIKPQKQKEQTHIAIFPKNNLPKIEVTQQKFLYDDEQSQQIDYSLFKVIDNKKKREVKSKLQTILKQDIEIQQKHYDSQKKQSHNSELVYIEQVQEEGPSPNFKQIST